MKKVIFLRKAVQLIFFGILILTVFQATFPYSPTIASEFILWLDPLAGFMTMLAEKAWIPLMAISLITLFSAVIFGRGFCGWICPLGTLIDISDHILRKKKGKKPKNKKLTSRYVGWRSKNLRFIKYFLLLFFTIAAIIGWQYSWFFDPLPLIWRSFTSVIIPLLAWEVNSTFNLGLEAGIRWDWFFNSYDFIGRHILPLEAAYIKGGLATGIILILILAAGKISKRFWCRNLCPLGALLGVIGKFAFFQRVVTQSSCASCDLCSQKCKMNAIEENFVSTDKAECILCLNCHSACKAGETKFSFKKATENISKVDISRRKFIASTATSAVASAGVLYFDQPENRSIYFIRPPGAQHEAEFLDRCIRCNACVRVCATTGNCLQPVHFEEGLAAFWSPVADFDIGYCEYNCNLCGQVCPTSAIQPLTLLQKQNRQMGVAVIEDDLCIPYKDKENCMVCEEHCPTSPKAITFKTQMITKDDGSDYELKKPVVHGGKCIGCGICELKCPLEHPKAILISKGHKLKA